jgi:hypothetical protein
MEYYLSQPERGFIAVHDPVVELDLDQILIGDELMPLDDFVDLETWKKYCESMRKPGTWVDESWLRAAVITFDISLKVFVFGSDENGEPVLGKPTLECLLHSLIIICIIR